MKNFTLLVTKCEGFSPLDVISYVQKCEHNLHVEKVFANMLKYALTKISETVSKEHRCYLYDHPRKEWSSATQAAFDNAETIYKDDYGKDTKICVYKFQGEEKFNYFFIKGEQLGEKFELLFLEEL